MTAVGVKMAEAPPPAAPPFAVPPDVPPVDDWAVNGVMPSDQKFRTNCAPPPPVPGETPPAPPPPVIVAVTMQPPGGAIQRVVPAVLPSGRLRPVPKGSMAMPVADGVADMVREKLALALPEVEADMEADTVRLAATLGEGERDEPKDWLGDELGETLGEDVPVGVTGTQELRMMEPVPPGVPPALAPTYDTAPTDIMGQDALE